jgi:hypothetical protein
MGVLNIPGGLAKQDARSSARGTCTKLMSGIAEAPFGVDGCCYSLAQGIPRIVGGKQT